MARDPVKHNKLYHTYIFHVKHLLVKLCRRAFRSPPFSSWRSIGPIFRKFLIWMSTKGAQNYSVHPFTNHWSWALTKLAPAASILTVTRLWRWNVMDGKASHLTSSSILEHSRSSVMVHVDSSREFPFSREAKHVHQNGVLTSGGLVCAYLLSIAIILSVTPP